MVSVSRTITRKLDGEHVISEDNGRRSRDQIVLAASATKYEPGEVLGRLTANLQYCHLNPAGADGSQTASGILFAGRPANAAAAQKAVAHTRGSEHNGKKLTLPAGITTNQKATMVSQLAATGVIVRELP